MAFNTVDKNIEWQKDILTDTHTLIAGCSGSGKSVALRSVLTEAIRKSPLSVNLVLIDLKRVELIDFKELPHTLAYIDKAEDVAGCLDSVVNLMEDRYERMAAERKKKSDEAHIYVVIDEFAFLVLMCKKDVIDKIKDIALLGRAANIHLIACTQRNTKEIIAGAVSTCLEVRLCLRTVCAQDSRNVIGVNGAESLPEYGYGIFQHHGYNHKIEIKMVKDSEIQQLTAYWEKAYPILIEQRKGNVNRPVLENYRSKSKKAQEDDIVPNAEEWIKMAAKLVDAICR